MRARYYIIQDSITQKFWGRYHHWVTQKDDGSLAIYATLPKAKQAFKEICYHTGIGNCDLFEHTYPLTFVSEHNFRPYEFIAAKVIARRLRIIELTSERPNDPRAEEGIVGIPDQKRTVKARLKSMKLSYTRFDKEFTVPDRGINFISNLGRNWRTNRYWAAKKGDQIDLYGQYRSKKYILSLGVDKGMLRKRRQELSKLEYGYFALAEEKVDDTLSCALFTTIDKSTIDLSTFELVDFKKYE